MSYNPDTATQEEYEAEKIRQAGNRNRLIEVMYRHSTIALSSAHASTIAREMFPPPAIPRPTVTLSNGHKYRLTDDKTYFETPSMCHTIDNKPSVWNIPGHLPNNVEDIKKLASLLNK